MKKLLPVLLVILALTVVGCSKDSEAPVIETPEALQDTTVDDTETNQVTESTEGENDTILFSSDEVEVVQEQEERSEGVFNGTSDSSVGFGTSDTVDTAEEGFSETSSPESFSKSLGDVRETFTGTIVDAGMEDDVAMIMIENPHGSMVFVISSDTYVDENAMNLGMNDVVTVGFSGETMGGNPPHAHALSIESAIEE